MAPERIAPTTRSGSVRPPRENAPRLDRQRRSRDSIPHRLEPLVFLQPFDRGLTVPVTHHRLEEAGRDEVGFGSVASPSRIQIPAFAETGHGRLEPLVRERLASLAKGARSPGSPAHAPAPERPPTAATASGAARHGPAPVRTFRGEFPFMPGCSASRSRSPCVVVSRAQTARRKSAGAISCRLRKAGLRHNIHRVGIKFAAELGAGLHEKCAGNQTRRDFAVLRGKRGGIEDPAGFRAPSSPP